MIEMPKRIIKAGFIYRGKLLNWECEPEDLVKVTRDKRVIVGDVEIVPWSEILRQSLEKNQWYKVTGD